MWFPTQNDAIHMFARFLVARHGSAANRYARRTANVLQARGDSAGHAVWNLVVDELENQAVRPLL